MTDFTKQLIRSRVNFDDPLSIITKIDFLVLKLSQENNKETRRVTGIRLKRLTTRLRDCVRQGGKQMTKSEKVKEVSDDVGPERINEVLALSPRELHIILQAIRQKTVAQKVIDCMLLNAKTLLQLTEGGKER